MVDRSTTAADTSFLKGHALPGWLPPAACILVALGVRIWALRFQPWVTVDGTEYIRLGEALLSGRPFPSIFPPGYPALIAVARLVVLDRVMAAAIVSLISGALLPWPVWLLARRALSARWALLPTLTVVLHPALVQFSTLTMSESAYFLALYGTLALAAVVRPLASGLAAGAAFAIRPEALVPAAALAVREALGRRGAAPTEHGLRRAGRRHSWVRVALGFLVLAAPCWLYFHATLGAWTLTPKVTAAVRNPGATWRADEPRLGQQATPERYRLVERLIHYGPAALKRAPGNAAAYGGWLLHLWPAPLLLLSLWGFGRRRGIESLPLLQLVLLPFIAISVQARFLVGAIPALAILATVPLASVAKRRLRAGLGALWLVGAGSSGINQWSEFKLPFDGYEAPHREAGEWLAGVSGPGDRVMDRKPYVAFYADRPYRVIPDEPYERIVSAAVSDSIRYLVVDEGVARSFRPQLLGLLFDRELRDRENRLEMVYVGGHFKRYSIAIFRVLEPGEKKTGRAPNLDLRWLHQKAQQPADNPSASPPSRAGNQPSRSRRSPLHIRSRRLISRIRAED